MSLIAVFQIIEESIIDTIIHTFGVLSGQFESTKHSIQNVSESGYSS